MGWRGCNGNLAREALTAPQSCLGGMSRGPQLSHLAPYLAVIKRGPSLGSGDLSPGTQT